MYAYYVWKQWEIWLQNCKIDTKTMQCMWILNINDAWKKNLVKPKFLSQFRSVERQIRSIKNPEKKIFLKNKAILCRKLLKALCFMNEMHEYEIKSFSKTLEFNPDLPKTRFFNQFVLKTQTLNTFCIKIKEHIILDSHNKITHNIMYQV